MITQAVRPRGHPPVAQLVTRARNGDQQAWDALIERYAPLAWSICRRHRLDRIDAEDVAQTVWLRLVDHLDRLRDPDALPGWLATTTRRECLQVLDTARKTDTLGLVVDARDAPDQQAAAAEQELLAAERRAALREAFTGLPPHCQRLLVLLIQDPPVSYAEISARLGISVGSIGPMRRRCLDGLRRHPAIAALINTEVGSADPPAGRAQSASQRQPKSDRLAAALSRADRGGLLSRSRTSSEFQAPG
jgi:RNA polymerase sigma factor (sigma-70 family)